MFLCKGVCREDGVASCGPLDHLSPPLLVASKDHGRDERRAGELWNWGEDEVNRVQEEYKFSLNSNQ